MSKPIPDERIEFTLAGGGSLAIMTGEQSLFEEITNDLLSKAKQILTLMKKHGKKDYENKEFRAKWTPPPIPSTSDFLAAILWVIGHEREQLFAQLTKHSKKRPPDEPPNAIGPPTPGADHGEQRPQITHADLCNE